MTEQKKTIGPSAGKVAPKPEKVDRDEQLEELKRVVENQADLISRLAEKLDMSKEEEEEIIGLDKSKPFFKHCMIGGQYFEQGGKWYNAKGGEIPEPKISK